MKHLLSTAAIAAMLAASPALAADDAMKKQDQAQAQTQTDAPAQAKKPAMEADKSAEKAEADKAAAEKAAMDSGNFITAQKETDWLSSDLVGQSVQNSSGDALGDINNIVVNQDGQVVAVVIGVGGFLGIGEKDVAVSYDTLEFKEQAEVAANKPAPTGTAPGGSPMGQSPAANPNAGKSMNQAAAPDNPQDNMVIVLNTSRDQLEAAPAYKYVGEEAEASSEKPAKNQ